MQLAILATVAAVFVIGGPQVFAQSSGSNQSGTIEEIVVTAQKREQNLQDTPIAISAFTADAIEEMQIDGVRKISQLAPSLVFNQSGGAANTYMRGVGQDISTILGEPGVAMFIDGVYQGANFAQIATYNDLERIEVLRGPQGTLYGRNTTGGNINIYTKKPGFESGFETSLLYGDYDRLKATIAGQTTLVEDRVAIRGNFVTDSNDGYRDNPLNGKELEERDIQAGAVSVLFVPSDNVELVLRGDWNEQDDDSPAWDYLELVPGSGLSPLFFGGSAAPGADDVRVDKENSYQTEHWGVSADLTWDIGDLRVKSITAYRESDYDANYDNDGTDAAFLNTIGGQYSEQWSQELNLSGMAFNDKLEWITGLFYFQQDIEAFFVFDLPVLQTFFESVFPDIQNGFIPPLPPGGLGDPTRNLFYADRILTGTGSAIPFLDFRNNQDLESYAAFAQGTYSLTDELRLTAGVRYTEDEKDNTQTVVANISPASCIDLPLNEEWDEVTWKLGVDWDVADNALFYGSVSRGFKSGGFNGGTCNNGYDPETILSYEAGIKTTLAEGRVQLNLSAFYYDYEDFQARLFVNNASVVENAADTEMMGFEAQGVFAPGNGFEMDASASWMDTEYVDFFAVNPMTADPANEDASGNQVLRAPDFSYNVGVQYTVNTDLAGSFTLRYEAAYKDDYYTTVFNDDFALVPSHTVQNIRMFWRFRDNWEIHGFVENLDDEQYVENLLPAATVGGVIGGWAPPRTWGVQVRYHIGSY
jgi:iron complex outermembrane receptor protein